MEYRSKQYCAGAALGTSNNQPLKIYVNSAWEASILTNGVQFNALRLNGTGIVTYDTAGILHTLAFTSGDSGYVLSHAGTWVQGSNFSQWLTNGSNIYYNGGNIGVGTSTPNYLLTVNGTLFANYATIAHTLTVGTFKIVNGPTDSIVSVSSALNLASDSIMASNSLSAGTSLQGGTKGTSPITISSGQITSVLGNISFANNNLTTTGTVSAGQVNTPYFTSDSIKVTHIIPKDSVIEFGDPITFTIPPFPASVPIPASWNYPNGVIFEGTTTDPCHAFVGIGNFESFGAAALYISSCSVPAQLTIADPNTHNVLFNVDNSGNTNIYGQLFVHGVDAGGIGVGATFTNSPNYVYIAEKLNANGDYNFLTKAGDNGIFWDDNNGGLNNSSGFVIAPHSQSAAGIRIDASGKVSIGIEPTNMPGNYDLYVANGILTENVKVAINGSANWSDYVLGKTYSLMPLADLEKYIAANKHLPDVPSATDVQKHGIDVAAMDATLLKKIEEQTLYIIQQQKEINELQKEMTELQAKKKK